jgi:DNA ligase 1
LSSDPEKRAESANSRFIEFANLCDQVSSTRSKLAKVDFVSKYFLRLNEKDLRIASTFLAGRIFPPGSDSGEANVGYSILWGTFSEFIGADESAMSGFYMKHGDLGSAAEEALIAKNTISEASSGMLFKKDLDLQEVYSAFLELARTTGKGSQDRKRQVLNRLFLSMRSPVEAKYLIRILAGEMRIGLVEGLVEESIAKAFSSTLDQVRNARLVTGDVGLVSTLAKKGKLAEAGIKLFRPTGFMLAESGQSPEDLHSRFNGKTAYAEYKYDGIRAQIHASNEQVRIFSRNSEDITAFFPEIVSSILRLRLDRVILDGEIVAFDQERPLPFQALQRRLRKIKRSNSDAPVRYFAFDVLYSERPIIERPLSDRTNLLHSLKFQDNLAFSNQRVVSTVEDIASAFGESKSLGYEGLVLKDSSSPYAPGKRGMSWVKLKKELDTLDVVIVAAEYGHGKRAGVISDYTFAVQDHSKLKVVGKAYSGLTDQEIAEMTAKLKEITLVDSGYRRTVKPLIVLEVAFDAIQKSDRHDSGFALRFPRIKRIRTDKSVSEIDTIEKVEKIYQSQTVKL